MQERLKQWQSKIKGKGSKLKKSKGKENKFKEWWMIGAIATPILLWMVWWLWLIPDRKLQPDYGRLSHNGLSHNAMVTLAHPHRETLISGIGMVATVAGGVYLFLNLRLANRKTETANLRSADLNGANLSGANLRSADLNGADLSGAQLNGADLSGADLSGAQLNGAQLSSANLSSANLSGANLISADLSGADLNCASLRYANLSDADLRSANLSGADLRSANLSGADLNCTLLRYANFSEANLSGALLFFVNSREVQNLEPFQLKAKPSPFLCNAALPSYASQPEVNPNRDCDRIPQLLSDRYNISLKEAQEIVDEARQHPWH